MERLEFSGAVGPLYGSLGVKGLMKFCALRAINGNKRAHLWQNVNIYFICEYFLWIRLGAVDWVWNEKDGVRSEMLRLTRQHTQAVIQWMPERETDHSRPSSAKIKNEWSYTSTSHV
jgi:hypothetical protein